MENNAVKAWLKKKAARDSAASLLLALLALGAGVVVLTITFLFTYAIVWFGFNAGVSGFSQLLFNQPLHASHRVILLVCSAFLVLLFIGNARTSREYAGTIPKGNYPSFILPSGVLGSLAQLLAYSDASSRMIADLCFTGPRLVVAAWSSFKRVCRLARMDMEGGSRILAVLLSRASRFSYGELGALSGISDPAMVFLQMRNIDGVVFLESEPTGMSLTSDLREELRALDGSSFPPGTMTENPASGGTICELLGVPPNASLEEIEAAYEKWAWKSRHEKAGPHGNQSEKQTEQQIKAVNAAYEAFLQARRPKQTEELASKVENVWEQFRRSEK